MTKVLLLSIIILNLSFCLVSATTTSGGTIRNVAINGNIGGEKNAANGTNGVSWELDETNTTSTTGVNFYISWDENYLYLGWEGGDKSQQHIIWIDTDPQLNPLNGTGSATTFSYGNITATLPFTGNFFANIQSNYNEYRVYSGGSWPSVGTANTLTVASSSTNNDIEAIIPWNTITGSGKPNAIYFLAYINDPAGGGGSGYVYGNAPKSNTNAGGGSQTFVHYFGQYVIGGVSPFGSQDASLPVTLSSFTAISGNNLVTLKWSTESEINNLGFTILRANKKDGEYTEISSYRYNPALKGQMNSNTRTDYYYQDHLVINGQTYWYKLVDVDVNGNRTEHGPISATPLNSDLALTKEVGAVPAQYYLSDNYPNPFNPSTHIEFGIPAEFNQKVVHTRIVVYNILGMVVKELLNQPLSPGKYRLLWDGRDQLGRSAPAGLYIYQIITPNFIKSKKMLLIR